MGISSTQTYWIWWDFSNWIYIYIFIYILFEILRVNLFAYKVCATVSLDLWCIIHIPAKSTCSKFGPLSQGYKFQTLKIRFKKKVLAFFLSNEKCLWKLIPESYASSFVPTWNSKATTVGAC